MGHQQVVPTDWLSRHRGGAALLAIASAKRRVTQGLWDPRHLKLVADNQPWVKLANRARHRAHPLQYLPWYVPDMNTTHSVNPLTPAEQRGGKATVQ